MRIYLLLFICYSAYQADSQVNQINESKPARSEYFIGVGNAEPDYYYDLLSLFRSDSNIEVTSFCENERRISVSVNDTAYKSYDVFLNLILTEQPGTIVERKNSKADSSECDQEQLKQ